LSAIRDKNQNSKTMKTVEINIYKFKELSESAQQNALEKLYDLNVDYDWWRWTYQDAAEIGLEINEFDLYRRSIGGLLINGANECANLIMANHGQNCGTYKLAENFLSEYQKILDKYPVVNWDNEADFDQEMEDISETFQNDLLEEYLSILQNEYEYLTSEEAIIDSIEDNDYDFTEDGELY